ncbi:type IV pilin protein [Cryobacterium sp. Hz9]|uniref:type IV pilin protein n=1 Tax=Cryobacterium sp. Hz9 TaxID=1259167 RepID=UPI0018E091E5|nr:prepilin-type N-terminal cleavage/methylation domain-containing protein [Cryobacterium sp. Hz9]
MTSSITAALARKRSELGEKEKGFTLIELLVVVIIIGILAAIAVPIFLGQQESAKDAGVKSDLATAKIAVVSYFTDGATVAPTFDNLAGTGLEKYGFKRSDNTLSIAFKAPLPAASGSAFCIDGVSKSSGATAFKVTESGGVIKGSC